MIITCLQAARNALESRVEELERLTATQDEELRHLRSVCRGETTNHAAKLQQLLVTHDEALHHWRTQVDERDVALVVSRWRRVFFLFHCMD